MTETTNEPTKPEPSPEPSLEQPPVMMMPMPTKLTSREGQTIGKTALFAVVQMCQSLMPRPWLEARKALVIRAAEAYWALGGSIGINVISPLEPHPSTEGEAVRRALAYLERADAAFEQTIPTAFQPIGKALSEQMRALIKEIGTGLTQE